MARAVVWRPEGYAAFSSFTHLVRVPQIEKLSAEEFVELRDWLLEKDWEAWDRQIEQDASGKLEELFARAESDHRAGKEHGALNHYAG